MTKKIITILIIIIVLVLILGGIFLFFQNRNAESGEKIGIRDFFPFGRAPESPENFIPNNPENPNVNPTDSGELPRLRKISENPVAGAIIFEEGNDTIIRFTDKASGHIFEAYTDKADIVKISNTTIPKISEAIWTGKNSLILRYLDSDEETIETTSLTLTPPENENLFELDGNLKQGDSGKDVLNLQKILNLDPETQVSESGAGSPGNETVYFGPGTTKAVEKFQEKYSLESTGSVDDATREKLNEIVENETAQSPEEENLYQTQLSFLPFDIKNLSYIEDLQKIFYLQEDGLGSVGTLANRNGTGAEQIFESDAKEWISEGGSENIILTTKSSASFPGLVFSLSQNGSLNKILGGVKGLTAKLSKDGENLLFSESNKESLNLNILNLSDSEINYIDQKTLPEKCTWSSLEMNLVYCAIPRSIVKNDYPDSWYQGETMFNDDLWSIDIETGSEKTLQNLMNTDAINLLLSPNEDFIIFENKKDHSLWSYRISEISITENQE